MSGAGAQDRAGVGRPDAKERVRDESQIRAGSDEATAKERSVGSSTKRAQAAQQVQVRRLYGQAVGPRPCRRLHATAPRGCTGGGCRTNRQRRQQRPPRTASLRRRRCRSCAQFKAMSKAAEPRDSDHTKHQKTRRLKPGPCIPVTLNNCRCTNHIFFKSMQKNLRSQVKSRVTSRCT